MNRKTTKEILAESYLELAERKTINKISVVDIVENCSMTKPTFYRYFKDKYDLICKRQISNRIETNITLVRKYE